MPDFTEFRSLLSQIPVFQSAESKQKKEVKDICPSPRKIDIPAVMQITRVKAYHTVIIRHDVKAARLRRRQHGRCTGKAHSLIRRFP